MSDVYMNPEPEYVNVETPVRIERIEAVTFRPDDVLVVHLERMPSDDDAVRIQEIMKYHFPEIRNAIPLGPGQSLEVYRAADT